MSQSKESVTPWLAWARSGPSYKAWGTPVDHATADGLTTLCGIKEIGGSDKSVPFNATSILSCARCRKKAPEAK